MIHDLMGTASEVDLISEDRLASLDGPITADDMAKVGLLLTLSESASDEDFKAMVEKVRSSDKEVPVIGFTGTGGAGKSSLLDELMFLRGPSTLHFFCPMGYEMIHKLFYTYSVDLDPLDEFVLRERVCVDCTLMKERLQGKLGEH